MESPMLRLLLYPLLLAIPLHRAAIPTTIEGTQVTIYVSGDADVSFAGDGADIDADLQFDLSEIQTKFPTIVRSRKMGDRCEEEITVTASALRRADDHAEAAGRATAEIWRCADGKRTTLLSRDTGAVRLRIDVQRTPQDWLAFVVSVVSVEGSEQLRQQLAKNLAGPTFAKATEQALGNSMASAMVTAPLPPDLRSLKPRLNEVHFVDTGSAAIVVAATVSLTVPPEKFPSVLQWATGGQQ
jgi:hypothetical protein